jgi:hypothetical protein
VKKAYSCLTAAPLLDVALAGAAPAAAQALGMADGSKFDVALYGWFPAISGSTSFPTVDPEGPGMGSRHSGSKSIAASKGVAKRSILVSSLALHPYGHRMMQRERELTQNTMRRFGAAVAARFAAVATASDRKPHARQFFGHPPQFGCYDLIARASAGAHLDWVTAHLAHGLRATIVTALDIVAQRRIERGLSATSG